MIIEFHSETELPLVITHPFTNYIQAYENFDQPWVGKGLETFLLSFWYLWDIFPPRGLRYTLFFYVAS